MTAVDAHAARAMRRPVVILAGWLQFGAEIILAYAASRPRARAALYGALSRPPPPPPPDRDDEARRTPPEPGVARGPRVQFTPGVLYVRNAQRIYAAIYTGVIYAGIKFARNFAP